MTYKQLEMLLDEFNISMSTFCKMSGISRQVMTNAKARGGHFSASTAEKMKHFFEANGMWKYKDYIVDMASIRENNDEDNRLDISYSAYELAKDFDKLTADEQRMIVEMIAFCKSKKQD